MIPDNVGSSLIAVHRAAELYAQAVANESRLHAQRGLAKAEGIARIIGTDDPLTKRPHSATSAEKVVEQDSSYAAHLAACRQSVIERIRAEAEYECAKIAAVLEARLAVTMEA